MSTPTTFHSGDDDEEDNAEEKDASNDDDDENDNSTRTSTSVKAIVKDSKGDEEEQDDPELVAIETANEKRGQMVIRPNTEGMHLDLDGTERREPSCDGCAISPSTQGAHCPSPNAQQSSTRQSSYSPYGSTGCAILHIEPTADGDASPLMATLLHDSDIQNGNSTVTSYGTPTASSRPPIPHVRCLPTGSSQEDEAVEATVTDSPRASPVGQEDAVQAALYEDIAELEEKVSLSTENFVYTLCLFVLILSHYTFLML